MFNKNLLRSVARAHGLQCSYKNVDGQIIWSPQKTLLKMLEEFSKQAIANDADLKILAERLRQAQFNHKIKPCHVLWAGSLDKILVYSEKLPPQVISSLVYLESGEILSCELKLLSSRESSGGFKSVYKSSLALPIGYHTIKFSIDNKNVSSFLICPPEKLITKNKKTWGPFVPLYALKSKSDWGIGSLKEAATLASVVKEYSGAWMGLLPMLAGNFDYKDCDPSPYSSLSRLFWNEIYLDVEMLARKYKNLNAINKIESEDFQARLKAVRELKFVDYYQVYQLKKEILIYLSDDFFKTNKNLESDYKNFEAENPEINSYANFRSNNLTEQNFHRFVQYEMNNSLKDFANENQCGLYMDYPVGVNDSGFDYKEFRSVFFGEVSVGAPPEPVFALGQDWGFPAFHPRGMQADNYNYFRKSLKSHLKFCKILRLDHIMGLHRIYSVPKNFKGDEGVYLRFPPEELFAVVILEAHRAGADLIGENLGTVPLAVEKIIRERNMNGMWVLQCETWRDPSIAFAAIPNNSLACINTHDMPMLASYKKGSDLALVESLNILSNDYRCKFELERSKQINNWESKLSKEKFVEEAITNVAKSPAKYFVVNLEDLWGEEEPQNIPGTWKEYPNWRKKFKFDLEDWPNSKNVTNALSLISEFRK